jgi:hypothetical protein
MIGRRLTMIRSNIRADCEKSQPSFPRDGELQLMRHVLAGNCYHRDSVVYEPEHSTILIQTSFYFPENIKCTLLILLIMQ